MTSHNYSRNVTARVAEALQVGCPYCLAAVGQPCWTLKAVSNHPVERNTRQPHHARTKAVVIMRMKEKK